MAVNLISIFTIIVYISDFLFEIIKLAFVQKTSSLKRTQESIHNRFVLYCTKLTIHVGNYILSLAIDPYLIASDSEMR